MLAQEIIRRKRDGDALTAVQIESFVQGLARGSVSDAQGAAFAMAVCWRGMSRDETVALTLAMRSSGEQLRWDALGVDAPRLDKHSTGGIGDMVSLMLGPMLAACGAVVPMISGRGLGHTGGTLDKLEAIAGYQVEPSRERLREVLRSAGVAIIGADAGLAPADRKLYAIRDVTATVDCVPLITASILAKKLAAGLDALVLDVKVGNGAFMTTLGGARELAHSLVEVGNGAGLPTRAVITDMDQPLGPCAGNALELRAALRYLRGELQAPRLHAVVMALGATALQQGGLAEDDADARARLQASLDDGSAAERFERMVAGLGGPHDVFSAALPTAPLQRPVPAERAGFVAAIDTRALGLAVVALGGGRLRAGDAIDLSVGLDGLLPVGAPVDAGSPLAIVHASTPAAAEEAVAAVRAAYRLADAGVAVGDPVLKRVALG